MKNEKYFYRVIVKHSKNRKDVYERTEESDAEGIYLMVKGLYTKAEIKYQKIKGDIEI